MAATCEDAPAKPLCSMNLNCGARMFVVRYRDMPAARLAAVSPRVPAVLARLVAAVSRTDPQRIPAPVDPEAYAAAVAALTDEIRSPGAWALERLGFEVVVY